MVTQPQFLLFCDARASENYPAMHADPSRCVFGRWHFVLERLDGEGLDAEEQLEAADSESSIHPDRLALLSVVRGLEALEQPSRVNLVTTSRYVSRGLKYGLSTWRESDYQWERFGVQKPIRNADLWQRVDHALQYHGVTCRLIQSELAGDLVVSPVETGATTQVALAEQVTELPQKFPTGLRAVDTAVARGAVHENAVERPKLDARAEKSWHSRLVESWNWWEIAAAWVRCWRSRRLRTALLGT